MAKRGSKAWRTKISRTKRQNRRADPEAWSARFQRGVQARVEAGTLGLKRRGGNGCGPSRAQSLLHDAVGGELEYVVSFGKKIGWRKGWPCCYILDIGFPQVKVGIDIDGNSHDNPKSRRTDSRKKRRLKRLGWTVLRLRNQDVVQNLEAAVGCVRAACQEGV